MYTGTPSDGSKPHVNAWKAHSMLQRFCAFEEQLFTRLNVAKNLSNSDTV